MDEFKLNSKLYMYDPWEEFQAKEKNKQWGRRATRRSLKQNSSFWYREYEEMITPMDHWDSVCFIIWDEDYNYWDSQDIYQEYWDWYREYRGDEKCGG